MGPVYKKKGKLQVRIDFRNLNKATLMDGYPIPVANLLVDTTSGLRCTPTPTLSFVLHDPDSPRHRLALSSPTLPIGRRHPTSPLLLLGAGR